jgi:hypothetical protein
MRQLLQRVIKVKKGKERGKGKGKAITNSAILYTFKSFMLNNNSINLTPSSLDSLFANPFIAFT